MATQKQIEANRLNAEKSTGPRTAEGKSKVRLNAVRDGFNGQITSLSDEDRPVFEKFNKQFIDDLAPKTVMELSLASTIAWDTWRLNHLRAIEMNLYALGAGNLAVGAKNDHSPQTALFDAVTFARYSAKFAIMSIYEQRLNRSLHKNLATLRDLQAERKRNYKQDCASEVVRAEANDINGLPYEAPRTPSENGFVFSTGEILAASNRVNSFREANDTVLNAPMKVRFAGATSGTPSNILNWPGSEAA